MSYFLANCNHVLFFLQNIILQTVSVFLFVQTIILHTISVLFFLQH